MPLDSGGLDVHSEILCLRRTLRIQGILVLVFGLFSSSLLLGGWRREHEELIRVQELQIVDAGGNVRGSLSGAGGGCLTLKGASGNSLKLAAPGFGATLDLASVAGNTIELESPSLRPPYLSIANAEKSEAHLGIAGADPIFSLDYHGQEGAAILAGKTQSVLLLGGKGLNSVGLSADAQSAELRINPGEHPDLVIGRKGTRAGLEILDEQGKRAGLFARVKGKMEFFAHP